MSRDQRRRYSCHRREASYWPSSVLPLVHSRSVTGTSFVRTGPLSVDLPADCALSQMLCGHRRLGLLNNSDTRSSRHVSEMISLLGWLMIERILPARRGARGIRNAYIRPCALPDGSRGLIAERRGSAPATVMDKVTPATETWRRPKRTAAREPDSVLGRRATVRRA